MCKVRFYWSCFLFKKNGLYFRIASVYFFFRFGGNTIIDDSFSGKPKQFLCHLNSSTTASLHKLAAVISWPPSPQLHRALT